MEYAPTTYDKISEGYEQSESASKRKNIVKDEFKLFLQNEKPNSLLDLGCGTGVFAVIAKQSGAKKVVGIDISLEQIKAAQIKAQSLGLEIEYLVQDNTHIEIREQFDAISSIFGFCYAPSQKILREQLKSTCMHLKTKGSIFAVVSHPDHPTRDWGESYRVYAQGPVVDGTKLRCDFLLDGKVLATDYKFYWNKKTWESALSEAGLVNVVWKEFDEHSTNI